MLSDDSSSESETGRFKCQPKKQEQPRKSGTREDILKPNRNRFLEDKYSRQPPRRDERRYRGRSRSAERYSRPTFARRPSAERSGKDRYQEATRYRRSPDTKLPSRSRGNRSSSRNRSRRSTSRRSRSRSYRKDNSRDNKIDMNKEKSASKKDDASYKSKQKSLSPENKGKRSVVCKPAPSTSQRKKSTSPIIIENISDKEEDQVQPGSYYSMIPAVITEPSLESSDIDSSDDERLRAKLLNLEKELQKTRKKKHKKKHKRSSKSHTEKDRDTSVVEVSSTTDLDKTDTVNVEVGSAEVTSTQKKESSEEGEISSEDDTQEKVNIDPSDLRYKLKQSNKSDRKSKVDVCGPALPPHLERSLTRDTEGPSIPPYLQRKPKNIGPSIPEDMREVLARREVTKYESSDEDVGIGPLPTGAEEKWSEAHQRLEERALDIKIKKLDGRLYHKSDIKSREEWMLELPEGKAKYLGLEARSFRAKAGPDMSDRSSWTDTPEDKKRKALGIAREEEASAALQREARARHVTTRDEEQEKLVKKHKKSHKRDESLLELHQKKIKKKKKKEEDKKERRPFSRDVDLQVNRFDDAQKKSIIKKAQHLDTRFSHGEGKFL